VIVPNTGLRAALAPLNPSSPTSLDAILETLGVSRPTSCREIIAGLQPVKLAVRLNDGTCSGSCEIDVAPDGHVKYVGHVHNSGLLDVRYIAITSVPVVFEPVLIAHQGTVGGTVGIDARDEDWHEQGQSELIRTNWWAFRRASANARTQFGTSTGVTEILTSLIGAGTPAWVFEL
jgi:hypothetical protein